MPERRTGRSEAWYESEMPELPEVEVTRRNLEHWSAGRPIEAVDVRDRRVVRGAKPEAFVRSLEGRMVSGVERRGKWLRFVLSPDFFLYSHLGMTGKWLARPAGAPLERFERLRLALGPSRTRGGRARATADPALLLYCDARVLGGVRMGDGHMPEWEALGPDPLADGIDRRALASRLQGRRTSIKEAIMDQGVLAGIGNVHATESLFRARIDPRRPAASLTPTEVRALASAIDRSIREALEAQTGPELAYVGEAGAVNPFAVYRRAKEPCPRCRRPLKKVVIGGRSTVFCEHCQK